MRRLEDGPSGMASCAQDDDHGQPPLRSSPLGREGPRKDLRRAPRRALVPLPGRRRRLGRFANALVDLGVEPGDRVAVQVEKSIEAIMLYLGTIRAGAVFLPLNTAYTAAEIEYFVGDAEPRVFVCDPAQSRCAEADRGEGRRPARDARRLSVAGRLGRHAGPDARGPGPLRRRRPRRRRPRRDPLHLGHDRALEGRDADATTTSPRTPRRSPTTWRFTRRRRAASTRCRSSTPTACSSRPTRSLVAGAVDDLPSRSSTPTRSSS